MEVIYVDKLLCCKKENKTSHHPKRGGGLFNILLALGEGYLSLREQYTFSIREYTHMEKVFDPYTEEKSFSSSTELKKSKTLIRGLRFLRAPLVDAFRTLNWVQVKRDLEFSKIFELFPMMALQNS